MTPRAGRRIVALLRARAREFEAEAQRHDLLSDVEALERAAQTIRLAAVLVQERVYDRDVALAWLDASATILTRIEDAHRSTYA